MNIITIIGARPQFIKAAAVSKAISDAAAAGMPIQERVLHTGQHYDYNMSDIFFRELGLADPAWHLGCKGTVEEMKCQILKTLEDETPDYILVYGDTNSTLAGALVAEQMQVPLIHIEAGLRSGDMTMPEERNRILTDRLSHWLFCPTEAAVRNLLREGITSGVRLVGDVMYDAALRFTPVAEQKSTILQDLGLSPKSFVLCTIHRAATADSPQRLLSIFNALRQSGRTIILPLHPRTKRTIEQHPELQLDKADDIRTIDPVSYFDMLMLEHSAQLILTDSGGIQKEAYFSHTPCITLRDETEWVETVEAGWNKLAGTDTDRILQALKEPFSMQPINEYGDGNSAQIIVDTILNEN